MSAAVDSTAGAADEKVVPAGDTAALNAGGGDQVVRVLFLAETDASIENEEIFLLGDAPELGSWKHDKAVRLKQDADGTGSAMVKFESVSLQRPLEYKYLVRRTDERYQPITTTAWETSKGNRKCDPQVFEDPSYGYSWDRNVQFHVRRIRGTLTLRIHYNLKPEEKMHVTGDPIELGGWISPGPIPMDLTEPQPLPTGGLGRFWQLTVPCPDSTGFQYRYVVKNKAASDRWEREPNRKCELDPEEEDIVINDVNFISEMEFNLIPPNIIIGPYPQAPEDLARIKKAGALTVLNVQTDEDMRHRGIHWEDMLAAYKELGMKVARWPIQDFNPESLENNIHHASDTLKELLDSAQEDEKVYVHCTAGMSRAAATVIMYLAAYSGYGVHEAYEHVKEHRKVIAPNMGVVYDVAKRFAPQAIQRDAMLADERREKEEAERQADPDATVGGPNGDEPDGDNVSTQVTTGGDSEADRDV